MNPTNQELGDAIGVGHSMASRIRNGKRLPGASTCARLAAYLGIEGGLLLEAHEKGAKYFGEYIRTLLRNRAP